MRRLFVTRLEIGWFHPIGADSMHVEGEFSHVPLAGLDEVAQFFRMRLEARAKPAAEHLVVGAYHPPASPERVERIRAAIRAVESTALSLIVSDRIGWARVSPGAHVAETAAAVAVVKAAAGWDESDPIVIEIGNLALRVRVERDLERDAWDVRVEP